MIVVTFIKSVLKSLKYNTIRDEWFMYWHIMGPKLYFKYMAGIAVEGVDFY